MTPPALANLPEALSCAFGLMLAVELLRALLPEKVRAVKPFSCDVCMSSWGALFVGIYIYLLYQPWGWVLGESTAMLRAVVVGGSGGGGCLLLLSLLRRWRAPPSVELAAPPPPP